jgi:hypothetical protein
MFKPRQLPIFTAQFALELAAAHDMQVLIPALARRSNHFLYAVIALAWLARQIAKLRAASPVFLSCSDGRRRETMHRRAARKWRADPPCREARAPKYAYCGQYRGNLANHSWAHMRYRLTSAAIDVVATAHLGDILIHCLCDIALLSFACSDLDCLAAMTAIGTASSRRHL